MTSLYLFLVMLLPMPHREPEPTAAETPRCSLPPPPHRRSVASTVLLAAGSSDTIPALPGRTELGVNRGHTGPGTPGPIYAQILTVDRLFGADSAKLARSFEARGDRRVAIVPWDYGPTCEPVRWTGGFVWVPIAQPATFALKLRPDSLWMNGIPIFDAFTAVMEPYPLATAYRNKSADRVGRGRTDRELTAAEYFDLLVVAPTRTDVDSNPIGAWRMFVQWQQSHPELIVRFPANVIADDLSRP